jgi:uncharacterized protein (DUF1330 family)
VVKSEADDIIDSASSVSAGRAQGEGSESMPAYFLVDIREIKDAAKLDEYRSRVAPTVQKFGGRYLVRGGPFEVVEGTYQPVRIAMLEFPTMDQARSWYNSQDYRELKQMRLAATVCNGFFMTGS